MKKHFQKMLALLLCICLFASGINVYAAEVTSSSVAEQFNPTQDKSDDTTSGDQETTTPDDSEPVVADIELTSELSGAGTACLKWTSDDKTARYRLYRATEEDGEYSVVATLSKKIGLMTYEDSGLELGKTYYYIVEKYNRKTLTGVSESCDIFIKLSTPTNVKTSITSANDVKLTWNTVKDASGYTIYRSTSQDGTFTKLATSTTNSYTDTTPASATAYYYKITAYVTGKSELTSDESDVTPAYTKTNKPVVTVSYADGKVSLSWTKVDRAESYSIYRKTGEGSYKLLATTTKLSYTDSSVAKNKSYTYKVQGTYTADDKTIAGFFSSEKQLYTSKIDPNKKMIALTFDDGPGPYTQAIVDCLAKYDAHATFFVVGNRVNTYKSALKSAAANGNEIGNHTYSHPTLTSLSTANVQSQISKTDSAVKSVTGITPSIVRAPGGATNSRVRNAINKPFIYWSIDTLDWKYRNSTRTVNVVMNNVKDGDIILMHDIHKTSKEAALILIPKLVNAGYQLVTVSELAQYRGYTMQNHVSYSSFRKK